MEKQVIYDRWIVIDTSNGTTAIPQALIGLQTQFTGEDVAPYIDGQFISAELVDGYGARLSMPGYMDCTEWTVFTTEQDAWKFLSSMYDDE